MKQLEMIFEGRGEVKGFTFCQVAKSDKGYIYSVTAENKRHYEVFRHTENTQFNCVSYPGSNSFGLWAWTFSNIDEAVAKFAEL